MSDPIQTPPAEPADDRTEPTAEPAREPRLPSLTEALAPLASKAAAPDDEPTGPATPGASGDEPSKPGDGSPSADEPADGEPSAPPSRRQQARERAERELSDLRGRAERAEGELGRMHRERWELLQRAADRLARPGEIDQLQAAILAYDPDLPDAEGEARYRQARARLVEIGNHTQLWSELSQAAHLTVWGLAERAIRQAGEQYGADLDGIDLRTTMPEAIERLCKAVEQAVKAEHAEQVAELEERLKAAGAKLAGHAKAPELGGRSAPSRRGADGGFDPRKSPHQNLEAALAGLLPGRKG